MKLVLTEMIRGTSYMNFTYDDRQIDYQSI